VRAGCAPGAGEDGRLGSGASSEAGGGLGGAPAISLRWARGGLPVGRLAAPYQGVCRASGSVWAARPTAETYRALPLAPDWTTDHLAGGAGGFARHPRLPDTIFGLPNVSLQRARPESHHGHSRDAHLARSNRSRPVMAVTHLNVFVRRHSAITARRAAPDLCSPPPTARDSGRSRPSASTVCC
jgi:hypothetical protein